MSCGSSTPGCSTGSTRLRPGIAATAVSTRRVEYVSSFLTYTIVGLVVGCIYALSATGLVVTYTTSGIFNFAHGAIGMVAAFCYWQLTEHWHWPAIAALAVVL